MKKYKIAVLDDYQNVTLESADWSVLPTERTSPYFRTASQNRRPLIERLLPFDVVCVMRERSPLPRDVIERLPNLKLIASTGSGNALIDVAAASEHGIAVVHTSYRSDPTIEFTWATAGTDLRGKTLGVLGLGRVGGDQRCVTDG
jgi:lactate dehydrogenase-like 2-hydroxyacid dehydrogenase